MDVENVIYIFAYNFANVGMKPVCKGWNIFVHLYNKKVLKYGEQDVIFVNLVWVIVEVPLLNRLSKNFDFVMPGPSLCAPGQSVA